MVTQFSKDILKESSQPMIIKAFATWCPHCTNMKPIFEELEKELGKNYIFTELDVDTSPDLAHELHVESIPTFIFMKNKKEVHRVVGERTLDEMREIIENI